jgi:hypothetical protein
MVKTFTLKGEALEEVVKKVKAENPEQIHPAENDSKPQL